MYTGLQAPLSFIRDISEYKYSVVKRQYYGETGNERRISHVPIKRREFSQNQNLFLESIFQQKGDNLISVFRNSTEIDYEDLTPSRDNSNISKFSRTFGTSRKKFHSLSVPFEDNEVYQSVKLDKRHKHSSVSEPEKDRSSRGAMATNENASDMLLLELHDGRPHMFLNLGEGIMNIYLNESYPLNDNRWHRIDILWDKEVSIFQFCFVLFFFCCIIFSGRGQLYLTT